MAKGFASRLGVERVNATSVGLRDSDESAGFSVRGFHVKFRVEVSALCDCVEHCRTWHSTLKPTSNKLLSHSCRLPVGVRSNRFKIIASRATRGSSCSTMRVPGFLLDIGSRFGVDDSGDEVIGEFQSPATQNPIANGCRSFRGFALAPLKWSVATSLGRSLSAATTDAAQRTPGVRRLRPHQGSHPSFGAPHAPGRFVPAPSGDQVSCFGRRAGA